MTALPSTTKSRRPTGWSPAGYTTIRGTTTPVLGLREGTWLRCEDGRYFLEGMERGARLFRRDEAPVEYSAPAELTGVLPGAEGSLTS
ncbi:hypothetical protein AXH35_08085 [Acidipropionibacterium acidipropionici]|uniref:Uncharacterized protein n=1 Tax=Acidipropionibacterium acidipropionici TaxID=1748 RepID=A0AAC8YEV6_9ACTN|nr:hypothetical protein AXH35_08085 [Acidipropionibacterium acidipropionici]AOZ46898.1 hypothetical protein A8L58_09540 [Acidipropionibacterium acidipropionici]